ncbi:MAG: 50S ribosomal protein L21 [Candidatus Omnitrophota bacterium]
MFAVIQVGDKQFSVKEGDVIEVPHIADAQANSSVTIETVLVTAHGNKVDIGQPNVKGSTVVCDVMDETKGPKIYAFKFKRRKGYRKKIGHRQDYTLLKVKEIKV